MSFKVAHDSLEPDEQTRLASWRAGLAGHSDRILMVCLEYDLDREVRLSRGVFASFLRHLGEAWERTGKLDAAWIEASAVHRLRGPAASPPDAVVRVYRRQLMIDLLARVHGMTPAMAEFLLVDLLNTQDRMLLDELRLGREPPVWGGFDPDKPATHPADGCSAERLLDLLGLPSDWYPRGEALVVLRFAPANPRVPTLADAGWDNPWWMPAPRKGGHGRARDIAGITRADLATAPRKQGHAEIICDNARVRDVVEPDPVDHRFLREAW